MRHSASSSWISLSLSLCLSQFIACGDKSMDSAQEENPYLTAFLTLRSINDRPQIEIAVASDADHITLYTEEDGSMGLPVEPNAPFVLTATENDSLQHRYVGYTTDRDFALDALFLDRGSWMSLLGGVGLTEEVGHGHLWVAVVDSIFKPIANAAVTLDNSVSDTPFVLLETNVPWAQSTLAENGKAFVFFPNISPQEVSIHVSTPTDQTCSPFVESSHINTFTTTIYANSATVVWFICT